MGPHLSCLVTANAVARDFTAKVGGKMSQKVCVNERKIEKEKEAKKMDEWKDK